MAAVTCVGLTGQAFGSYGVSVSYRKFPFGLKRVRTPVRDRAKSIPNLAVWAPDLHVRLSTSWSFPSSRICWLRLFPPKLPEGRSTPGRLEFANWSNADEETRRRASWITSGESTEVSDPA